VTSGPLLASRSHTIKSPSESRHSRRNIIFRFHVNFFFPSLAYRCRPSRLFEEPARRQGVSDISLWKSLETSHQCRSARLAFPGYDSQPNSCTRTNRRAQRPFEFNFRITQSRNDPLRFLQRGWLSQGSIYSDMYSGFFAVF
jgi:hypothetical protein